MDQLREGISQRVDSVSSKIDQLRDQMHVLATFTAELSKESTQSFGLIISMLKQRGELTDLELKAVLERQASMSQVAVDAFLERERAGLNPLNADQYQKLQSYVDKARRGEFLSAVEVGDYNKLVSVLEREKAGDPGVWPLVALGAFLRGLVIASEKEPQN